MPKSDVFSTTHIIIHEVKGVERQKVQILAQTLGQCFLAAREEADEHDANPHYHLLVKFDPPVSREVLTRKISKLFSLDKVGRNDKHLLMWNTTDAELFSETDRQSIYCSKGPDNEVQKPVDVVYKSISDELLLLAHNTYWNNWNQVYKPIRDKNLAKKSEPKETIIIKQYQALNISSPSFRSVCQEVMKLYKGKVNDHVAWPVIQAVLYHYYPSQVDQEAHKRFLKRFAPAGYEGYEEVSFRSEPMAPCHRIPPPELISL